MSGAGSAAAVGGGGAALITAQEGSTQHRTFQFVGWGIFFLLAVLIPYNWENFRVTQLGQAIAWGVVILGINLVIGYSGLLSLGHIAFAGTGAYTTMILVNDNNWDYWMTWPVVIVICFAFGALVGLPALKIRGLYLALVTVSLAAVFPIVLKIEEFDIAARTGGDNGRVLDEVLRPPGWAQTLFFLDGKTPPEQRAIYQYICIFATAFVMFWLVRNILKSRPGRAIIAIRDNQIGAAVSGVPLTSMKVITFAVSAAVAGIGGSLVTISLASVGPTTFDFNYAILTLMGLVLGGVATLHGNWIGGLMLVFLQDYATRVSFTAIPFFEIEEGSPLTRSVFGLVLVLVAFFAPGGIMSMAKRLKARIIRVVPNAPPPEWREEAKPVEAAPTEELTGAAR